MQAANAKALATVLVAVLGSGVAVGQLTVEDRTGTVRSGTPVGLRGDRLLLALAGEGDSAPVPVEWLLLTGPSGAAAAPAVPLDVLVLASSSGSGAGAWLFGRTTGGDAFGLRFSVEGSVSFKVPFERVERLLPQVELPLDRLGLLAGGGMDDRVWQRREDGSLDGVSGVVDRLDATGVVLDSALGPLTFPWSEVVAVILADPEAEGELPAGPGVLVRLRGGSRFAAVLLDLDDGHLVLATRFAPRLEVSLDAVASMVRLADDVLVLASLDPVEVAQWPTIGQPDDFLFPWRRDLSVTGRPLAVGGLARATGLGVHANARLVYALPEGARSVRVTVGLCDEVSSLPATASVRFELRVDGELLAAAGPLREGEAPAVLRAPLAGGARRMELLTLDGGDDDAGDRAAWVDGVLLIGQGP